MRATAALLVMVVAGPAAAGVDSYGVGSGRDGRLDVSSPGTVINTYTAVTGGLSSGSTELLAETVAGFGPGDLVLVLQASGHQAPADSGVQQPIDLSSQSTGSWELARVASINLNRLELMEGLLNSYADAGAQVVRLPEYTDVTIAADAGLRPLPWDGTTGGVVAFLATGSVRNDGSISVSGAGFRGGPAAPGQSAGCAGPDAPAPDGARKGEGIAGARFGPQFTSYGNFTNGGGGGCDLNSGGGGGANAGPGGVGGNDASQRDLGGRGGAPILNSLVDRITFGGGGGAGHNNSGTFVESGGNGGGAIFIRAGSLSGAGVISANGLRGGDADQDGAGGGGAGGSIYLRLKDSAVCGGLEALGGGGGNTDEAITGPGGGGGGGRMLVQARDAAGCSAAANAGMAGTNPATVSGSHWGAEPGATTRLQYLGTIELLPTPYLGVAAPRFTSSPNTTGHCGAPYRYSSQRLPQIDGAGPFTYSLSGVVPGGMTVDGATGELSWAPTPDQVGVHPIELGVSSAGGSAAQRFEIHVECRGPTRAGVGCAAGPGEVLPVALLALRFFGIRARRRAR